MKPFFLFLFFISICNVTQSQTLPNECKLDIGTNLSGVSDYGTEIPFVNLMKVCRTWYSKDAGNPSSPFNSESADSIAYRADGYPTYMPQTLPGRIFPQKVATIWAVTDGWKPGNYVVMFDGEGSLGFWGGYSGLTQITPNKYTFTFAAPIGSVLEMTIDTSLVTNPVRNIRIVHADYETTYATQPFNPLWLDKLLIFKSVRFMDWGQTNNWGQDDPWTWDDPTLFNWNQRAKMDHYTWANNKGIPYEMMIKLMNDYNLDGWVCIPHRASNSYIDSMAMLFYNSMEPELELTVEYSNEIWNWMFGQAQWCNKYGCILTGVSWPEGIVPYIQTCLDRWTAVYSNDINRIKRAVGLQTGWLDVSQRIAFNLDPNSFDVLSPTYYFGIGEDSTLDVMGASATALDINNHVRSSWETNEKYWMNNIKTTIADSLNKPLYFYEGGQHLTPTPFGTEPTYAAALLDIQRSTLMYDLYNDWYDYVRTLHSGSKPLKLMNFSFIGTRSARYGSWGILETMTQDTALVYAPKYQSTIENMADASCFTSVSESEFHSLYSIYPNPAFENLYIQNLNNEKGTIELYDITGKIYKSQTLQNHVTSINISNLANGIYVVKIKSQETYTYKFVKE